MFTIPLCVLIQIHSCAQQPTGTPCRSHAFVLFCMHATTGREQPAAYWVAAVMLLAGHVTFCIALRRSVQAVQELQKEASDRGAKFSE